MNIRRKTQNEPLRRPVFGSRAAFTLVELLVVIAIISVLAAMLMPALNRATEAARACQCANNLKTIGNCIQMYVGDNQGYFPPSYEGGWLWFCSPSFLIRYAGGGASTGTISTRKNWIAICPKYRAMKHNGNYGLSEKWFWHASLFKPFHRASELRSPSRAMHAVDVFYEGSNVNAAEQYYTGASWMNAHYRHNDRANDLMGDGHIETIPGGAWPASTDAFWTGQ